MGLERKGFNITTFNDPILALEEIRSHEYDLIITDIRMPKMNGFELYREIKKHNGHTPVCFFSAFEIYHKEFAAIFPDIDGTVFLNKPIKIAELVSKINQLTKVGVG
jgi:CheY-like chemotaxis protein